MSATRTSARLSRDIETDVAIVGAGIAGISTAFFTLKYTNKRVVILEKFKLAHGATGHNAGQVVTYFERGLPSLVEEFGLERAAAAEKALLDTWELIDEMFTDANLDIAFSRFEGHGGLTSYEQIMEHLKANMLRARAHLPVRRVLIAENAPFAKEIPSEFESTYSLVPLGEVQRLLETKLTDFLAVISFQKGCMNSALFCQEVVAYLQTTYPERFTLYEHAAVHKVILRDSSALLDAETHTVKAERVVLCTNGFENLHILNETGLDIDARYHHLVHGKIGYMSAYLEAMDKSPIAISYYTNPEPGIANDYFYLTRRPFEHEKGTQHNLISIGGPEQDVEEGGRYAFEDEYPEDAESKIDSFVHKVYSLGPTKKIDYVYTWHGLMGYTRNGVRLIGPEPQNSVLLYNLGCNGVGIIPSVHGGRVISRYIAGEAVPSSIFDVPRRVDTTREPQD